MGCEEHGPTHGDEILGGGGVAVEDYAHVVQGGGGYGPGGLLEEASGPGYVAVFGAVAEEGCGVVALGGC